MSNGELPDPAFLFPSFLFGDGQTTKKDVRRYVSRALKGNSWDVPLEGTEFVDVRRRDGDIVLMRTSYRDSRGKERHWRLYWLDEFFESMWLDLSEEAPREQGIQLLLASRRHLWLFLALAFGGHEARVDLYTRELDQKRLLLPILRHAVSIIPKFVTLSPRFAVEAFPPLHYQLNSCGHWATQIAMYGYFCGFQLDLSSGHLVIRDTYGGDAVRWLLDTGLVEQEDGEFRLCEEKLNPTG